MKNTIVQLCIVILAISGIHAVKLINQNTIKGKVSEPQALNYVWAINNNDSVITHSINGEFSIKVKPGNWKILLHTFNPYKNIEIDNVVVNEGHITNLGEIKLIQ